MAKRSREELELKASQLGIDIPENYNDLYKAVQTAEQESDDVSDEGVSSDDAAPEEDSAEYVFFRNAKHAAEKVNDGTGFIRFEPYFERYQGDRVKVGYLAVYADSPAVPTLRGNSHIEEISAEEYDKATENPANKAPK